MIEIYAGENGREFYLHIRGHADYGQKGEDIVCAAVSILIQTLHAALSDVTDTFTVTINSEGQIESIRANGYKAIIAYHTILKGLQLIEQDYPDYISIYV